MIKLSNRVWHNGLKKTQSNYIGSIRDCLDPKTQKDWKWKDKKKKDIPCN